MNVCDGVVAAHDLVTLLFVTANFLSPVLHFNK